MTSGVGEGRAWVAGRVQGGSRVLQGWGGEGEGFPAGEGQKEVFLVEF